MCAISTSPEADDASTSIMSARRKYTAISGTEDCKNTFLLRQDKNTDIRHVPTILLNSINNIKNNVCDEFSLMQNNTLERRNNFETDYCGFPYYRNNKDAVLVKDVGISCGLLKEDTIDPDASIRGIENYLVRQLKLEYKELSNITRKINAYTKDILKNLATRCKKEDPTSQKSHVISKHIIASQYIDNTGNPCLKLRFRDDIKKRCPSSRIGLYNSSSSYRNVKEKMHGKHMYAKKQCEEFNKAFPKRKILELSSKYNGLLLQNYLITKREKASSNASKTSLHKAYKNFASPDRSCIHRDADKSRKPFYTSKCNPLVFTNWKEVSRRKDYARFKNAFTAETSGES